jgi:hypothetical protein
VLDYLRHFVLILSASAAALPGAQPLPFSHAAHTRAGAQCADCHNGKAARIGIAAPAACMARCHARLPARDLARAAASGRRIRWERVYEVPHFVRFSHRRHRRTDCAACHGDVARRDVLEREVIHTMKFCRACHLGSGAKASCGTCHEEK